MPHIIVKIPDGLKCDEQKDCYLLKIYNGYCNHFKEFLKWEDSGYTKCSQCLNIK